MRGSESLIEECEAFLTGHLGENTDGSGRRSSPSSWLNALAHADLQELQRLAQSGQGDQGSGDLWAQAISFLAAEILWAGADDGGAVRRIQVDLIVPIELRWSRTRRGPVALGDRAGGPARAGTMSSGPIRPTRQATGEVGLWMLRAASSSVSTDLKAQGGRLTGRSRLMGDRQSSDGEIIAVHVLGLLTHLGGTTHCSIGRAPGRGERAAGA